MIPVRLELDGFLSYADPTVVDFDDVQAVAIVGDNGSGKTSLIEAIGWALFGKGRGRSPDDFVNAGRDRCRVVFTFDLGGERYAVQRDRELGKTAKSALLLSLLKAGMGFPVGGDSIAETQAKIVDLVGLDFDAWTATSYIGQGKADTFTRLTPADRKALLFDVLGLTRYEAWADVARHRESEATSEAAAHRIEAEAAQRVVDDDPEDLDGARRLVDAIRASVAGAEAAVVDQRADLDAATERGAERTRVKADLGHARQRRADQAREAERDASRARDDLRRANEIATSVQANLTEVREARCYACGQALATEDQRSMIAEREADLARLTEASNQAAQRVQEAEQAVLALKMPGVEEGALEDRLAGLPEVDLGPFRSALTEAESERAAAQNRLSEAERTLAVAEDRHAKAQEARARVEDLEVTAGEWADQSTVWRFLWQAFGRDGIPAILIDAAIPAIEDEANRLLGRLTAGRFAVRLDTLAAKKTGGLKETLDIVVADDVSERPLEALSGGERQALDLSLRIALARLIAERAGRRIETLIIDEGFTALDAGARQRTIGAVHDLIGEFRQILFVTHLQDLADAFPTQFRITRSDGGSSQVQTGVAA